MSLQSLQPLTHPHTMKEAILNSLCRNAYRTTLVNGITSPLTIIGIVSTDPRGYEYGYILTDRTSRLVVSFTSDEIADIVLSLSGESDPTVRIVLADYTANPQA